MIAQPVLPQDQATTASPQFAGVNLGHASDTTLTRVSAGVMAVEGLNIVTGLGAMTWAALQAGSYANGSGGLSGLPVGTQVFITNWNAWFTPNPAMTMWRPVQGRIVLKATTAAITNSTADGATYAAFETTIPAGLVEPGGAIIIASALEGALNTNSKIWYHGIAASGGGAGVNGGSQLAGPSHTSATNASGGGLCRMVFPATNNAAVYSAMPMLGNQSVAAPATPLGAAFNMNTTACYAQITQRLNASGVSMQINWAACYYESPGT